jgi:hypothetical protein
MFGKKAGKPLKAGLNQRAEELKRFVVCQKDIKYLGIEGFY